MADFEPRRAEAGQEFGYTADETREIAIDDEVPEGWRISATDPGEGKHTILREGAQRTLKADAEGVVHPKTQADVDVLDSFALPVARKAAEKSEATKTKE
jgi:hypothetical protein